MANNCPVCGNPYSGNELFCSYCGAQRPADNTASTYSQNDYKTPTPVAAPKIQNKGLTYTIIALGVILLVLVVVLVVVLLGKGPTKTPEVNNVSPIENVETTTTAAVVEQPAEEPTTVIVVAPAPTPATTIVYVQKTPITIGCYCIVTTNHSNLNMRSGPGQNYSVIASVPKGTKVYVSDLYGNWAYVCYGNYCGYVSTSYLTVA